MGKLDKLISKFFDGLRQNKVNAFTRDALKDPEIRKAVKKLKKNEEEILGMVKRHFSEHTKK